ncbi:hypothetical protein DFH11DRAFT_1568581 [Phellopilus nigrolimitatus]|nr:hypothetical protein DFH11DRAFT_1568581 [Phellopilus nigrolimitatus]
MSLPMQLSGKVKTRAMISCEECGREFQRSRKADLQRHIRIHTNEKPFVCPRQGCGKAFKQSSALKNHSNFHSRDNAFVCSQCNLSFFDKPTYNRHVREKHELEYVFACSSPTCSKFFKRKTVFNKHMQDKHGIYCSDADVANHRVSAAEYVKTSNGSKSTFHRSSSPLPRLADALQNVRPPRMPSLTLNNGAYYTSSPASYALNNSASVHLRDPYTKPDNAFLSTPYIQTSSSPDFCQWTPSGIPITPADAGYYNGQFMTGSGSDFMGIAPLNLTYSPAPLQQSVPYPPSLYSSGTSSGSTSGSARSYTPNSSLSRASSVSPVSATNSLGNRYTLKPVPPYDSYFQKASY